MEFPVALSGAKASTLMWAPEHEVEPAALQQLCNIAALEYVHGLRVMPDVHLGKGATVGSVIAMESAISPSAVGVDIGCGVSAVRTSLTAADLPEDLKPLRLAVEATIPVGFRGHDERLNLKRLGVTAGLDAFWGRFKDLHGGVQKLESRAHSQLGSLGGGNHFLEITLDSEDRVWLTLHSGSRNIGKELAERHISIAKTLPQNQDLPDRDLAVFLKGSPEMAAYRRDLDWAQEFAMRSRKIMMELFKGTLRSSLPTADITFDNEISCHHNYVAEEEIDGRQMLVTRKGAIRAGSGEMGLIPGSMGTGSYIVRGLGNPASFQSASHGAGRRMSRTKAKATYTVEDLIEQTHGVESRKDSGIVDEIPGAYKDLSKVIAAQSDLVDVVQHLRTILCVKG
ncbi:RtcB family protein [Arthrobacter sp. N1]|uniref:RtcB family protein n=1 Tax=Arthrobacter sp. N1 TaxID=619291 RepID=UPI003BAE62C5